MKKNIAIHGSPTAGRARPKVVLGIFLFMFVVLLAVFLSTKGKRQEHIVNMLQTSVVSVSVPVHHEKRMNNIERSVSNNVAPETEAALNQFGLSGTNLVKITVRAQSRPPVILPNPMNQHPTQQ